VEKQRSAFWLLVVVVASATQNWLASHFGPRTWSELLHKQALSFEAVPSLVVHSTGFVHLKAAVSPPLVLHQ
jgi:hypothetical protein